MYRLTNLTLDKTTTYRNKDLVYQALDRENAKVKHQDAEGYLLVEELDKKGVVLDQEEIYLPFEGIADTLFLQKQKETQITPKSLPFLKRSKVENDQEPSRQGKQEPRMALSDTEKPSTHQTSSSFLKRLGMVLLTMVAFASFVIAGISFTLNIKQGQQVAMLTEQVDDLSNLQTETGKLDTFVRFFLPHYFSEQGKVEEFVSSSLELKNQSGQLQSVILESVFLKEKQTYKLTYVLAVKEGDAISQKRLTFQVKKKVNSTYGYEVVSQPVETTYPKEKGE